MYWVLRKAWQRRGGKACEEGELGHRFTIQFTVQVTLRLQQQHQEASPSESLQPTPGAWHQGWEILSSFSAPLPRIVSVSNPGSTQLQSSYGTHIPNQGAQHLHTWGPREQGEARLGHRASLWSWGADEGKASFGLAGCVVLPES